MVLIFYFLVLTVMGYPALKFSGSIFGFIESGDDLPALASTAHHLVRRGIVSPSNWELKINAIAFGVPAVLCFTVRM